MASPTVTLSTFTTVVETRDFGNGKYEVKEIKADEASFPDLHSANRKQISFPLPIPGFVGLGYYDIDDKEIGLYITFMGTQVGAKYSASLEHGLDIGVDLGLGSGRIRIFRAGNQIKVGYSIDVGIGPFKKSYSDDFKVLEI